MLRTLLADHGACADIGSAGDPVGGPRADYEETLAGGVLSAIGGA